MQSCEGMQSGQSGSHCCNHALGRKDVVEELRPMQPAETPSDANPSHQVSCVIVVCRHVLRRRVPSGSLYLSGFGVVRPACISRAGVFLLVSNGFGVTVACLLCHVQGGALSQSVSIGAARLTVSSRLFRHLRTLVSLPSHALTYLAFRAQQVMLSGTLTKLVRFTPMTPGSNSKKAFIDITGP